MPGLPDIAQRVQRAIANPDFNVNDVAHIIQSDIPLSGRIIQIANSPLYRAVVPADNCYSAVSRLGMKVIRSLVMSFAVKRLYTGKNSQTRKNIEELWKHSVKIGAICFTLARVTPGFDPEKAMLAGLTHDIGALLIFQYSENNTDLLLDEQVMQNLIQNYKHKLGAVILKHWRFDADMVTVSLESENWYRNPEEKADIADVVMVSHVLENLVKNKLPEEISDFESLPVFRKFPVFTLGKYAHRELLMESQDEIAELQRLLK